MAVTPRRTAVVEARRARSASRPSGTRSSSPPEDARCASRVRSDSPAAPQGVPDRQGHAVLEPGLLTHGVDEPVHPRDAVRVGPGDAGQPQHRALDRDRRVGAGQPDDRPSGGPGQRAGPPDGRRVEVELARRTHRRHELLPLWSRYVREDLLSNAAPAGDPARHCAALGGGLTVARPAVSDGRSAASVGHPWAQSPRSAPTRRGTVAPGLHRVHRQAGTTRRQDERQMHLTGGIGDRVARRHATTDRQHRAWWPCSRRPSPAGPWAAARSRPRPRPGHRRCRRRSSPGTETAPVFPMRTVPGLRRPDARRRPGPRRRRRHRPALQRPHAGRLDPALGRLEPRRRRHPDRLHQRSLGRLRRDGRPDTDAVPRVRLRHGRRQAGRRRLQPRRPHRRRCRRAATLAAAQLPVGRGDLAPVRLRHGHRRPAHRRLGRRRARRRRRAAGREVVPAAGAQGPAPQGRADLLLRVRPAPATSA